MTILETIPIFKQPGNYNSLIVISLIITMASLVIAITLDRSDHEICGGIFTIIASISLIIFIISIILGICEPTIDTGRKQYIVRLNNNISINEFYNKYKIIEHTKYTDVYTVEELEDD